MGKNQKAINEHPVKMKPENIDGLILFKIYEVI